MQAKTKFTRPIYPTTSPTIDPKRSCLFGYGYPKPSRQANDVNMLFFHVRRLTFTNNLLFVHLVSFFHSHLDEYTMRISPRLLASPVTPPFKPGVAAPKLAILPPIPLYRRLLRTHRKRLGPEERTIGDLYLKDEFHRHKDIDNPIHIIGFLSQWQQYGEALEGDSWKETKLDVDLLDKMSDQQIGQMYELMQAIQKRGKESADEAIEGVLHESKKD